jgi:hypothetical protein
MVSPVLVGSGTQLLTQVRRRIIRSEWLQHVVNGLVPNVNQHVRIGEAFHRSRLLSLIGRDETVAHVPTIVVLGDLLVRDRDHAVVIVLEPPSVFLWFDQRKVMAPVQISGMYQYTVQLVNL